ncbi:MAG TPA: hypothetical protein PKW75_07055, partial [candidate division Zixibacteria bacterium]|nr:hypothetical protein [candidate division Zixibacteria bacterium]
RALPFLQAQVRAFGQVIPVSRIAQHTSTLLGISALLSGSWRGWLLPAPATGARFRTARDKWRFWLGSGLFATLFALAVTWAYRTYWPDRVATTFTTFGLAGWAGFFWVVAVCGAISRFLPGRGRSGPAGDRARQPVGAWRSQS